jgi:hypothetical protein
VKGNRKLFLGEVLVFKSACKKFHHTYGAHPIQLLAFLVTWSVAGERLENLSSCQRCVFPRLSNNCRVPRPAWQSLARSALLP